MGVVTELREREGEGEGGWEWGWGWGKEREMEKREQKSKSLYLNTKHQLYNIQKRLHLSMSCMQEAAQQHVMYVHTHAHQ